MKKSGIIGLGVMNIPAVREAVRLAQEQEMAKHRETVLKRMGLMEHPVLGIIERP